MPDINYFWNAHYTNGFQLKGTGSIKQIPNLEDIKLMEVYIFDEKKEIKYHLGVGLESGMFHINSEWINPHPYLLNKKPKLRPIFFIVRQRHFRLGGDGIKKPVEKGFYSAGLRVGWQTTIEVPITKENPNGLANPQRMMTWMETWNHIAIMSKR